MMAKKSVTVKMDGIVAGGTGKLSDILRAAAVHIKAGATPRSHITIKELSEASGVHQNTIRRKLNDPERLKAELPGSVLVELPGVSVWLIPVEAALNFKKRPPGRRKKGSE